MDSDETPVVELVRDGLGNPVLTLYHLDSWHLRIIYDLMMYNGDTPLHEVRSAAMVHLSQFDSFQGMASFCFYNENSEHYETFKAMLSKELGINFPSVPICDFIKTA